MANLAIYLEFHKGIEKAKNRSTHSQSHWQICFWQSEELTTEEEKFDKNGYTQKKNDLNIKGLRNSHIKFEKILKDICKEK